MRIVFIMGYGRSGSTILDTILGSSPVALSVGELTNLPGSGWPGREYCACGRRGDECDFWSAIRDRWEQKVGKDSSELHAIQKSLEAKRYFYRAMSGKPDRLLSDYAYLLRPLYEAIAEEANVEIIVDSSKNPQRAMALARIPEIDLRLIHLVRDPRDVSTSLMKSFKADLRAGIQREIAARSPYRTALFWSLVNFEAEFAMRMIKEKKGTLVRYEDLVSNPASVLTRIGEVCGIDMEEATEGVVQGRPLKIGHTVAGNRLRMKGSVRLQNRAPPPSSMGRSTQLIVGLLSLPFLKRYGYRL